MELEGAIFDMDGTLLDSSHVWKDVGARFLRQKGFVPPENLNGILRNKSLYQAAIYCKETYQMTETPEEIIAGINAIVADDYRFHVQLKPGVENFLKSLHKKGVRLCVATASDRELAAAAFDRLGVLSYFKDILTCTQVKAGKDTPEIYRKALELLGSTRETTLVFEDALHAIETAVSDGFLVVGVFDEKSKTDTEKIKALSTYYFETYPTQMF